MKTKERREGRTPNGGVASEIYYQNNKGDAVHKAEASRAEIVELDAEGNSIFRTHVHLNKPKK